MSGLIELKDWIGLTEAGLYLSTVLKSQVSEADLLQLAVEGKLRLSVYTVNPIDVRIGKVISRAMARRVPGIPDKNGHSEEVILGVELDDGNVLQFGRAVETISGVLDIPMLGGDRLTVERRLQRLRGGPKVTSTSIDGAFLVDYAEEDWYQIQAHYSDNEYFDQSKIKTPLYHPDNFYPAGGLPHDVVLVLRPESLFDFVSSYGASRRSRGNVGTSDMGAGETHYPFLYSRWLNHDTWSAEEGLQLLAGIDPQFTEWTTPIELCWPDSFTRVVFLENNSELVQPDTRLQGKWTESEILADDTICGAKVRWQNIRDLWRSGDHPARAVPKYFVDWAEKKRVAIPWLGDARKQGYFTANESSNLTSIEQPMTNREKDNLLRIIGGLVELILGKTQSGKKHSIFESQEAVIDWLGATFPNARGLKERNLDGKFAEGKRLLKSE
jgi:hypothetical protein